MSLNIQLPDERALPFFLLLCIFVGAAPLARAQSGFYAEDVTPGASFDQPTATAFAPDGRIFVAQKGGAVYIIEDGKKRAHPFMNLSAEVLNDNDRGLLGLALDPNFARNHYVYLLYTVDVGPSSDGENPASAFGRLVRYTADGNRVDYSSKKILIGETFSEGILACGRTHGPAALRFGTDGTLLVSTGDARAGARRDACFGPGRIDEEEDIGAHRAQHLTSMAGKILRVDPATGQGVPSNPFYTGDGTEDRSRVWAYGLRNPFRFAVRPGSGSADARDGKPGALYIGDVGQATWEELSVVASGGRNMGWPCYEGPDSKPAVQEAAANSDALVDCPAAGDVHAPALYWRHGDASRSRPPGLTGTSVIGGSFYPGTKYPAEYEGRIFYGDFAQGWMAAAEVMENGLGQRVLGPDLAGGVVDMRYDPASEYLYLTALTDGEVLRLRHENERKSSEAVAQVPYRRGPAEIPGSILVGFYDVGGEGVAYHDTDAENRTQGLHRDDEGVDATANLIGWIRTGEWVEYTVDVQEAGTYDLKAELGTPRAGRRFHVEVEGADVSGSIAVPNTGAWNLWQKVTTEGLALEAGEQVLRIAIDRGPFNINRLRFVAGAGGDEKGDGEEDEDTVAPAATAKEPTDLRAAAATSSATPPARRSEVTALNGSYPNPFAEEAAVEFTLAERVPVRLSVYNLLGRRVATLVDRVMPAGTHRAKWDGTAAGGQRLSSGVYLYRLEAGSFTDTKAMTLVR